VHRIGDKVVTGKSIDPHVYYEGYPTRDRLEKITIPELVAMFQRGRQDIKFPLGIYIYAYYEKRAFPRNRLYVQEVPNKSFDLLEKVKRAVYFIDERFNLFEIARDGTIRECKAK
jgi:hypothetical protein